MKTQLVFIRHEGIEKIDVLSVVAFEHHIRHDTPAKLMEALKAGVTQWVKTSGAGKELWKQSSEDLNIGDLVTERDEDKSLYRALHDQGILRWKETFSLTVDNEIPYDTHLVEGDEL